MFRSFKIFEFLFSGANFCRSSFAQIKAQLAPNYIISIICHHLSTTPWHWVPNSWMDFHRDDGFFEKNKTKNKAIYRGKKTKPSYMQASKEMETIIIIIKK